MQNKINEKHVYSLFAVFVEDIIINLLLFREHQRNIGDRGNSLYLPVNIRVHIYICKVRVNLCIGLSDVC